jgi:RNA polymerase sigma-70 factor (ECF subfamily)
MAEPHSIPAEQYSEEVEQSVPEQPKLSDTDREDRALRDKTWLARIRDTGDTAAFEQLFRAYMTPLTTYAESVVKSHEVARDVVTDVMLELWKRRSSLVIRTTVASYLYGAVFHGACRCVRRQRLERHWQGKFAAEGKSPMMSTYTLRGPEDMEAAVDREILWAAIAELPERARCVAIFRWVEGHSRGEIAERLGITVRTVNNHLTMAMRTIRMRLGAASSRTSSPPGDAA